MTPLLRLTLLHELPGRLRVRLSRPLGDPEAFGAALRGHSGVHPVRYSPRVQTVLATYDPASIRREELLVRMALAFSVEHGCQPVRIQKCVSADALTAIEAVPAAALLAASLARPVLGAGSSALRGLERTAAALTGGAVLLHGRRELRGTGVVHPELLSLVYLVVGWMRGRPLQAAVLTWAAAFGRHLKEPGEPAVVIRPDRSGEDRGVAVSAVPASPAQALLRVLPTLLRALQQAGRPLDDMLANLRDMSRHHDHVLDALGPWTEGIPVRFAEWKSESVH